MYKNRVIVPIHKCLANKLRKLFSRYIIRIYLQKKSIVLKINKALSLLRWLILDFIKCLFSTRYNSIVVVVVKQRHGIIYKNNGNASKKTSDCHKERNIALKCSRQKSYNRKKIVENRRRVNMDASKRIKRQ